MTAPSRLTCVGLVLMVVAGWLLTALDAAALPRYSARYGQSCHLCHVNPTGGGMRDLYATHYLIPTEMVLHRLEGEEREKIDTQITSTINIGTDLRTIVHEGEGNQGQSSVFAMQGDLYLAFQLDKRFLAYLDQGQSRTQEFFGLARVFPAHGYFKAGRFMPDYGWRFADHQTAVRRYLLFPEGTDSPSSFIDSGLEVGFYPCRRLELTASLQEGGTNNGDSYTGRAVLRRSFGRVNVALGGSYLRRTESAVERRAAGGFAYFNVGPFVWIGEVDETRRLPAGEAKVLGMLISQEVAWQLVQGVDLRLTYSFQDPNRAYTTGSRSRWGGGVDTLLHHFFGLQFMVNYYDFEQGQDVTEEDYFQLELVLHFLY